MALRTAASSSTSRIFDGASGDVARVGAGGRHRRLWPRAKRAGTGAWSFPARGLALDRDLAAGLSHEAEHHAESQPGPLPLLLGREKRLEDARRDLGGHAMPGIGHRDADEPALAQVDPP